jgi:hypothetical protein
MAQVYAEGEVTSINLPISEGKNRQGNTHRYSAIVGHRHSAPSDGHARKSGCHSWFLYSEQRGELLLPRGSRDCGSTSGLDRLTVNGN